MITLFLTRLHILLQALGAHATRRVTVPARGANFIEYALLAVIAVILFVVFRGQITGLFNGAFDRVRETFQAN